MSFREGWRLPHTIRRHFGKVTGVVAVALAGAAIAAPEASAVNVPPPGGAVSEQCVGNTYGPSNESLTCVVDLQVLVSNIWRSTFRTPLAADGIYGPLTEAAVREFNELWVNTNSDIASPSTWRALCQANTTFGFQGAYWHGAGCQYV